MKTTYLKRFALLLGCTVVLASCSDSSPTTPVTPAAAPEANLLGGLTGALEKTGLISCAPMAPAWASETIGPSGGTMRIGPHTFVVPPGALDHYVTISAYAPSDKYNQVEFEPEGLQFNRPASLTMSYSNCNLLGYLLPKHIAYVDQSLNIQYLLQSVDNLLSDKVTGEVNHFSDYIIAW